MSKIKTKMDKGYINPMITVNSIITNLKNGKYSETVYKPLLPFSSVHPEIGTQVNLIFTGEIIRYSKQLKEEQEWAQIPLMSGVISEPPNPEIITDLVKLLTIQIRRFIHRCKSSSLKN